MAGMHAADSGGMSGMMSGDSAMMASMRFAPRHVLANAEALGLSPEQRGKIEALAPMPHDSSQAVLMHMRQTRSVAATVRALLTADQIARVEQLPAPCPMLQGSPADSTKSCHQPELQ